MFQKDSVSCALPIYVFQREGKSDRNQKQISNSGEHTGEMAEVWGLISHNQICGSDPKSRTHFLLLWSCSLSVKLKEGQVLKSD